MKKLFFSLLLLVSISVNGQDLDIYPIKQDDKLKMPDIPYGMTFDEFQILSRTLRMKDMVYAMIVPGYTHFYAKENTTGYVMLGLRSTGFAGLAWIIYDSYRRFNNFSEFDFTFRYDEEKNRMISYQVVSILSFALIFGTYFYDWIHGQYILTEKQEAIRYKYGMKIKMDSMNNDINPKIKSSLEPRLYLSSSYYF